MQPGILDTGRDPFPESATEEKRPLRLMDTVLRDSHQSLLATRMRTKDMLPILDRLDRVGYWSVEMWGGATFDSCLRYLREDPWERIRLIRKAMPHTRLQMLMRGQNIVGYRHYPDDIVDQFVKRSASLGIDVFRIFDALNDTRNMRRAIEAVRREGKIAEGAISYTTSPVHTIDRFVSIAKELEEMGCHTICIKDMAGLLAPYDSFELVRQLKKAISLPIHLHSHCTSGMAEAACLKGVEAGAELVDVSISSMAGGTSHPPTETIVAAFQNTPYDTGLDLGLLGEISDYFREIRKKYAQFESPYTGVNPQVLQYQIPGGMISNLANQLREQDALDRMEEVLQEVPRVRREMGYPPLVTPTSQIVGTQATLNVLLGERYQVFNRESRNLFLGKYGLAAAPVDRDLQRRAEETDQEKAIECRPADLLVPEWEKSLEAVQPYAGEHPEEDALSYALFPQIAVPFFKQRNKTGPDSELIAASLAAILHRYYEEQKEQAAQDSNGRPAANPWKMAGRYENLRGRGTSAF